MTGYASLGRPGHRSGGAQTYAQVGLETEVLSASPEKLITLLFDGAKAAMVRARHFMTVNDMVGRQTNIGKAIDIVESGLCAAVLDNDTVVSKHLIHTYQAIANQLLLANLHNDMNRLDKAQEALANIADAWKQITEPSPEHIG